MENRFRRQSRKYQSSKFGFESEGAAGIDGGGLHSDDDEYLWAGYVIIDGRGEWEGC